MIDKPLYDPDRLWFTRGVPSSMLLVIHHDVVCCKPLNEPGGGGFTVLTVCPERTHRGLVRVENRFYPTKFHEVRGLRWGCVRLPFEEKAYDVSLDGPEDLDTNKATIWVIYQDKAKIRDKKLVRIEINIWAKDGFAVNRSLYEIPKPRVTRKRPPAQPKPKTAWEAVLKGSIP